VRRIREGLSIACASDCPGGAESEWVGEAGVCGGDSGGPALDAGGRLIGVASRGAAGCVSPTYASLSDEGWGTSLRTAVQNAAADGDSPVPGWAVEADDDDDGEPGGCACADTQEAPGLLPLVVLPSRRTRLRLTRSARP
jgi:hypothetical protein